MGRNFWKQGLLCLNFNELKGNSAHDNMTDACGPSSDGDVGNARLENPGIAGVRCGDGISGLNI